MRGFRSAANLNHLCERHCHERVRDKKQGPVELRREDVLLRSDDRGSQGVHAPWKISMPLYRRIEKNAQLFEYKCVEFAED